MSYHAKTCFVLLERLDKKLLDRYSRKEEVGLETSVRSVGAGKEHKKRGRCRPRLFENCTNTDRHRKEIRERSRSAQESPLKGDLLRRKRKIRARPLQYTDDEDDSSGANSKENVTEKTWGGDNPSSPPNESQNWETSGSEIKTSHARKLIENSEKCLESDERKQSSLKERNGLIFENILQDSLQKTANAERELKPGTKPPEVLQQDIQDFGGKMDCVVNNNNNNNNNCNDYNVFKVKSEVEIVEEFGKHFSFERKVNGSKEGKQSKGAEREDFEDEEHDPRDEGEDDRATVVFERSLNGSATDIEEVFEMAEGKIRSVNKKKFQKKKITNRKKRTLVKFKRKRSMIGRTLAKVKKLKIKYSEVGSSGQQPGGKTFESVNERHVREVCGLVKRLHELYRIISQLQKHLPMDSEHAEHFIRAINTQQENFCKEIRKSQKTIIGGYDKMLSSFGNANTVSMEIGKRTSLSKEDIANVISRCAGKGGCEEKKSAPRTEDQELNSSQEMSAKPLTLAGFSNRLRDLISDKIETLLSAETVQEVGPPQPAEVEKSAKKDLTNIQPGTTPAQGPRTGNDISDPVSVPHPQSLYSAGERQPPKSLQRPNNEPQLAKEVGAAESHPSTHLQNLPSSPYFRVSQPFRNRFQGQWSDHSRPRLQFSPQKNCSQRMQGLFRDSRFRQFPQYEPRDVHGSQAQPLSSRPVHNQSSSIRAQYRGNEFPLRGGGSISYPFSNNTVGFFQGARGFVPPSTGGGLLPTPVAGRNPRLRIPSLMNISPYPLGYPQGRLPTCHFPRVPDPYSVPPKVRPVPVLPNFDISKHAPSQASRAQKSPSHSIKSYNNLRRNDIFPTSKSSEDNVSGAPSQPFPKEDQCPLENILTNLDGFLQANGPTQIRVVTEPAGNVEQTSGLSTEPASESVKCESYALDPTIPQKLTMRNCRLEAGPVLEPASEGLKSEDGESPDVREPEALNEKELKPRVYVCAQNGCKNPGVRICKGCLSIIYCSETCQLKHWTLKHKTECHQLKELRG